MALAWEDSSAVVIIKCFVLIVFICTSVVSNTSVLYATTHFKKLQTKTNYFIFNLALTDLLFALTGMPFMVVTSIAGEWVLGDVMCNICGLLNFFFCSVSIWTLVSIGLNRYIRVAKWSVADTIYTKKRVYCNLVGVWIFSLLISMPPLIGWSEFQPGSNTCLLNGKKDKSYSICLAIVDFVAPVILLTVFYSYVIISLKRQTRALLRHSFQGQNASWKNDNSMTITPSHLTVITDDNTSEGAQKRSTRNAAEDQVWKNTSSKQKSNHVERRVIKVMLVVVVAFFLCWTPFILAAILYGFGAKPNFRLMSLGIIIACLSSVINPFIYAAMDKRFQKAFRVMYTNFKKRICCTF